MHLVVFGAAGPTGRLVVRQALDSGHYVTAVTRTPQEYPLSSPHLDVDAANVTDAGDVVRVLAVGAQAVVTTDGVPEDATYSKGMVNILRAMTIHGITRLVCLTPSAVGAKGASVASTGHTAVPPSLAFLLEDKASWPRRPYRGNGPEDPTAKVPPQQLPAGANVRGDLISVARAH